MTHTHDLIILGGGMAGATLAAALAGQGLELALVEAAPLEVETVPNYDDRAIALAWGAQRIYQGLGLWSRMAPHATPIEHIHVSERGGFGITRLEAAEVGVPALGQVITARDLGAVLLDQLRRLEEVSLFAPARARWLSVEPDAVHLGLADGRELSARLLVAADGDDSFVRRQLCFDVQRRDFHQSAIVANVTPSRPHGNTAYERFTPEGPMALLPLGEGRCALVWTQADTRRDEVLGWEDDRFLEHLQAHFGWRLGRFQKVGRRAAYALRQSWVKDSIKHRVVLVGNAAHTLHPVAGQGFNLGIRDVAALADVVLEAVRQGEDPGETAVLQRYERQRRRDRRNVSLATEALVLTFTNRWPPLRLGRNLGLLGLEMCPPARRGLARAAMGVTGRLPRLLRGMAP